MKTFEYELRNHQLCSDEFSQLILAQGIRQVETNNLEANDWLIKYYYNKGDYSNVVKTAELLISEGYDLPEYRVLRGGFSEKTESLR